VITGNALATLSAPCLGIGEKLIICGVKGVHLVEFVEAVVVSKDEVDEFPEGLPPSASPSAISSVRHSILQPRLRASAPESTASSEEIDAELGDDVRVLATELWLVFPGSGTVMLVKAVTVCGASWPSMGW
jgi:hypothetical protein